MVLGDITPFLINGLLIGIIYGLMSVGLSLIFGVSGIVNMAHGEFFMLGAYTSYFLTTMLGLNPLLSCLMTGLIMFFISIVIYMIAVFPLRKYVNWTDNVMVSTVGLTVLLINLALLLWGPWYRGMSSYFTGSISIGNITVSVERVIMAVFGAITLICFWFFTHHTSFGKALRAVSDNEYLALLAGVNAEKMYLISFAIGGTITAISGGLLTPLFFIYPTVGQRVIVKSFAITIIGGMGSLEGPIYAGIIIGLVEGLTTFFWEARWADAITFIALILVLLVKPAGLFGKKRSV
jgi:branched-chain amino acid transport system permease protein